MQTVNTESMIAFFQGFQSAFIYFLNFERDSNLCTGSGVCGDACRVKVCDGESEEMNFRYSMFKLAVK